MPLVDARKSYNLDYRAIENAVNYTLIAYAAWMFFCRFYFDEPIITAENLLLCVLLVLMAVVSTVLARNLYRKWQLLVRD